MSRKAVRKAVLSAVASFAAGLLAGAVYWLLHVNSPAPPPIALLGLLGMVTGGWIGPRLLRYPRAAWNRMFGADARDK
jgi:XapX domain-containing protein